MLLKSCIGVEIFGNLTFTCDFVLVLEISSEIRPFTLTMYVWATHVYEGPFTTPYEHSLASCVSKLGPWTGYPYAFRCQRTVMYIQVVYEVFCVLTIFFLLLYKRMFER